MAVDPYLEWLGLSPSNGPRNHYQLLGLRDESAGEDEIRAAYEWAYSEVRRYDLGDCRERAAEVLHELSEAYSCLVDSEQRSDYDARLRRTREARETRFDPPSARDTHSHRVSRNQTDAPLGQDSSADDPIGATESLSRSDADSQMDESFALAAALERTAKVQPVAVPSHADGMSPEFVPIGQDSRVTRGAWWTALAAAGGVFVVGAVAWAIVWSFSSESPSDSGLAHQGSHRTVSEDLGLPGMAADSTEPAVPGAASANSRAHATQVRTGRMLRALAFRKNGEPPVMHLLLADPGESEPVEAFVRDQQLIEALATFETAAESPAMTEMVQWELVPTEAIPSEEAVSPRFSTNSDSLPRLVSVVDLATSRVVPEQADSSGEEVAEPGPAELVALRQVGQLTEAMVEFVGVLRGNSYYFRFRVHGRECVARTSEAWAMECARIQLGPVLALFRTTDQFERDPVVGSEPFGHLVLEHLFSPNFRDLPTLDSVSGSEFPFQATLMRWTDEKGHYQFSFRVLDCSGEQEVELVGLARDGTSSFFKSMPPESPVLIRVRVGGAGKLQLSSMSRLDSVAERVDFVLDETRPSPDSVAVSSGKSGDEDDSPVESNGSSVVPLVPPTGTVAKALPRSPIAWPADLDLPPTDAAGWHTLFPWDASEPVARLELDCNWANLPPATRFRILPVEGKLNAWRIVQQSDGSEDGGEPVAYLMIESGELRFQWRKKAAPSTVPGQLRNCILRTGEGDAIATVRLRSPLRVGPVPLFGQDQSIHPAFDLPDLPKAEQLECNVSLHQGAEVARFAGLGRRFDYALDDSRKLLASVSCRLVESRQLVVVAGLVEASQRSTFLTPDALVAAGKKIETQIARTNRDLDEALAEQEAARTRAANVRNQKRNYDNQIVASKARSIAKLEEGLQRMGVRLEELSELSSQLDLYSDFQVHVQLLAHGPTGTALIFEAGMGNE